MMLRLESCSTKVCCRFCNSVTDINALIAEGSSETKLTFSQRKDWMHEAKSGDAERPTVEQECEKCDNNLMYFTSRQTRSVDEGQTVYYECTKCGYTFSENT